MKGSLNVQGLVRITVSVFARRRDLLHPGGTSGGLDEEDGGGPRLKHTPWAPDKRRADAHAAAEATLVSHSEPG